MGSREPAATFIETLRLPFTLADDLPSRSSRFAPAPSFAFDTLLAAGAAPTSDSPDDQSEALDALRHMLDGLDGAARAVDEAQRLLSLLRDSEPRLAALIEALSRRWEPSSRKELPFALGIVSFEAPPSLTEQAKPAPRLLLRLLGRFEVETEGRLLPAWRGHRARRLLAYLALNRHDDISRYRLMGLFWPDNSEERAENNLSLAIMALRRQIDTSPGLSLIGFGAGCYFIDTQDIWIDAEEFAAAVTMGMRFEAAGETSQAAEAFDAAISLYEGDLLPGELYEEWTAKPRRRLQDLFVDALQRRSRLARAASDLDTSIALCRRLLDCDAANEEAHRQLMRDYLASGQRSRALAQMAACRKALSKHLGVGPEAETLALFALIHAGEPA